jgi:glyoxylase-like metal-dependent hydrolase (beta-lactamase superfamily II)
LAVRLGAKRRRLEWKRNLLRGCLTDELLAIPTPGHTPGHLSLLVASDGQRGLLLGDVAHLPAPVSEPDWSTGRARVLKWAERERMVVIFYHFPAPGLGRVARREGRPAWEALGATPRRNMGYVSG